MDYRTLSTKQVRATQDEAHAAMAMVGSPALYIARKRVYEATQAELNRRSLAARQDGDVPEPEFTKWGRCF